MTLDLAQRLIAAAIREAEVQGVPIAVTVVDGGGALIAFARMDGVGQMAVAVTRRKAVTATNFRAPTQFLLRIAEGDAAIAADFAKDPGICMVAGGVPILVNGACIGGIGVGGGRSAQDQAIAEKAVAAAQS